jgi:hypothetical protein
MRFRLTFFCAIILAIAGCGSESPDKGTLTLAVTDAPVDFANKVVVFFDSVEIKPAAGESFTVDVGDRIDLLALSGGGSEIILDGVQLDAGHYNWIRLHVNAERSTIDSFIELTDGTMHSLYIPSASRTGLKLIGGFDVPAGGHASFTLDFDLRKSVHNPIGHDPDYILRPTIRIINNSEPNSEPESLFGTLTGSILSRYVFNELCTTGNAVYIFTGHNAAIDDVDGKAPDPFDSAIAHLNADSGLYEYRIWNLPVGNYTVAFTCQAGEDDPATDDNILFLGGTRNLTILAGEITIQDI